MMRQKLFRIPICILLSFLMLIDYAVFTPAPVHALETKSVVVGAAAGAGLVLAAPLIGTALAAAGAGLASVGSAVVGGLAVVGGGLLGALSAVGGAVVGLVGGVAGWIAGIVCSPLFIPALVVIGVCVAGYFIYKHYKNKKSQEQGGTVLPGGDQITVTPGDYDMNPVLPPMNQANPITISDNDCLTIPAASVAAAGAAAVTTAVVTKPTTAAPVVTAVTNGVTLKDAETRYRAAYQKYTALVTTGGSGDVQSALQEYRDSYKTYMDLKMASGSSK